MVCDELYSLYLRKRKKKRHILLLAAASFVIIRSTHDAGLAGYEEEKCAQLKARSQITGGRDAAERCIRRCSI